MSHDQTLSRTEIIELESWLQSNYELFERVLEVISGSPVRTGLPFLQHLVIFGDYIIERFGTTSSFLQIIRYEFTHHSTRWATGTQTSLERQSEFATTNTPMYQDSSSDTTNNAFKDIRKKCNIKPKAWNSTNMDSGDDNKFGSSKDASLFDPGEAIDVGRKDRRMDNTVVE